jgi:hypothetical protein
MEPEQGNRRRFFRQFARESLVWLDELKGKPQCKTMELWELSSSELSQLIPQVCSGVEILPDDNRVCGRIPENEAVLPLFDSTDAELFVFNRFNGVNSIGQIAGEMSATMGFDPEESYARVRTLFLHLVRLRVCMPSNPGPERIKSASENQVREVASMGGNHEQGKG